ncbi:phosphopantetheine-binding protein [Curtobacterium sp. ISL-83]|uniref:phosphopantetheine-binding protein n=1 Tax=Curtobacterium sp. ISL-83 TaxID=2819145 RepID=UPI001BE93CA3|nr:phosphopantetheine-binding protein [Curtobacterium sp. ISL-83]MBT2502180.1 hypothetical protein [Curtobacterium sp. ISL-83]
MFRYAVAEDGSTVDLLFHHAVADGSAVQAFLEDFAAVLSGGRPDGDGVVEPPLGTIDDQVAFGPVAPAARPDPSLLAEQRLTAAAWSSISASSPSVTPFARLAAAVASAFPGLPVRAGLDQRLLAVRPPRGGDQTVLVTLSDGRHLAAEAVPTAILRGGAAPAEHVQDGVVVSLAAAPELDHEDIVTVRLGDYTQKYRSHVQVVAASDGVVVSVRAQTDAQDRLASILTGLGLGLDRGVDELTRSVSVKTPQAIRSPLTALLAAEADQPLWELGLDSLDLVTLRDEVTNRLGVEMPLVAYYSWETVGDAQGAIRRALPVASRGDDPELVELPYALDVFIDALRAEAPGTYEIDVLCTLRDGVVLDELVAAVDRVFATVPLLGRSLDFTDGTVVARRSEAVRCAVDEEAPRLALRAPQRLAWSGVHRGQRTLQLRLHHVIADAAGVWALLGLIDAELSGRPLPTQPSLTHLAEQFAAARSVAVDRWRDRLAAQPYPSPAGRGAGPARGDHHEVRVRVPLRHEQPGATEVVARAARVVGLATGAVAGTVGVGFSGRGDVGGSRAVASTARVLPVRYDRELPGTTSDDLEFARSAQHLSATELGSMGAAFPRTLVQFVRSGATPSSFASDVVFTGGGAKFELGVDVVESAVREILAYGLRDLYTLAEIEAVATQVAEELA